jgi:NADH-ubiquinone oxidoreductase chain 2
MPKISIIILLLELNTQLNIDLILENNVINIIKYLLLISSLLSLLLGTIVGLAQIKIKRLLAYSTISHVGFILLALAISTEQSIESLIFYIIQYTITNLNTFLIIIALSYILYNSIINNQIIKENDNSILDIENNNKIINFSDINYISEFKGQFSINPLLSLSLSICLFSMAGIPPLIGFFSKQFVLLSAIQNGYYFMAFIAIFVSVISASYYLKIIKVIHTPELDNTNPNPKDSQPNNSNIKELNENLNLNYEASDAPHALHPLLTNIHSFIISLLTTIILLFVLKPYIILSSIRILSLSIFYF